MIEMQHVGQLTLACDCGEKFDIPISAGVLTDEHGKQFITYDSDVSAMWLHSWTEHGDK